MATTHSRIVWTALAAVVTTYALAFATGCELVTQQALVTAGSCEGDAYGKDMSSDPAEPEPVEPDIWAEADGVDIVLHLDDLDANCCPSPGADLVIDGSDIAVSFEDVTSDEACGCMCITDFEVRIPDVGPGDYTLDVDFNGSDLATVEVTVP